MRKVVQILVYGCLPEERTALQKATQLRVRSQVKRGEGGKLVK